MNNGEERIDLYQWDAQIRAQSGIEHLAGVDEAGAGPLAGRVYAAAVILPQGAELPYLNDSKKVTPRRRELLFDLIREQAVSYSVAWAEAEEIDQLDILNCRMLAMQRAIDGLEPAPPAGAGGRQPGSRQPLRHHRSSPVGGEGGCPLRLHCRCLHPGQGQPGSIHGGDGPGISPIRL